MSSKLVKIGGQIEIPGDEVIVDLKIFKSNKVQLQAPFVHPRDLCKMLYNLIVDLQYASLKPIEASELNNDKQLVS